MECKLAANPESKRKVIGQILEYASSLWGMSYRELDGRIRQSKGKSLTELIDDAVAGEWDQSDFEQGVTRSLANGSFLLIIVVDAINDGLRRIIRYVNNCGESAFSLHALELHRFNASGTEILVPQLHGLSVKPAAPAGETTKRWTRAEFFETLRGSVEPAVVGVVERLYEWAEGTADRVWFGRGVQTGSFSFHYLREGKTISVFTVYTNGRLQLNYGWLSRHVHIDVLEEFHRRIKELAICKDLPADFSKWPTLRIADLLGRAPDLDKFSEAVCGFVVTSPRAAHGGAIHVSARTSRSCDQRTTEGDS